MSTKETDWLSVGLNDRQVGKRAVPVMGAMN